jgi:hypothetical protein
LAAGDVAGGEAEVAEVVAAGGGEGLGVCGAVAAGVGAVEIAENSGSGIESVVLLRDIQT